MATPNVPDVPPGAVAIPVGEYFALIDEADRALVAPYGWRPLRASNGKIYAIAQGRSRNELVQMHRLVDGTPADLETDHISGDTLDNRRCNLRPATRAQNGANKPKLHRLAHGRTPTSTFKGVHWDRHKAKWRAMIKIDRRSKHVARSESEVEAARAYDRAALAAWGEFAWLNFPDEVATSEVAQ